jgi:glycosyltransferase involved in cell wall biosynthesis
MSRAPKKSAAKRRPKAGPARRRLSAVLITRNEARNLPDCLASLGFCDEIVVVDNASTDGTAQLAAKAGARVINKAEFAGFGKQKQAALDAARGDWVLSIDADERVPAALAREIMAVVESGGHAGYTVNRKPYFLGKFLRHGGWYPDRVLRLARRDVAHFSSDAIHEQLVVKGSVGALNNDMVHLSYRTIDDVLTKQRRYALLSAQVRRARGVRGGLGAALSRGLFAFLKHYVLQAGLLDGGHGLVAAIAKSQEAFWRYLSAGWDEPDERKL